MVLSFSSKKKEEARKSSTKSGSSRNLTSSSSSSKKASSGSASSASSSLKKKSASSSSSSSNRSSSTKRSSGLVVLEKTKSTRSSSSKRQGSTTSAKSNSSSQSGGSSSPVKNSNSPKISQQVKSTPKISNKVKKNNPATTNVYIPPNFATTTKLATTATRNIPTTTTPNNSQEFVSMDKEVDFFNNPTILSRLVQNQKFAAAISRLEKQGPSEASVWVCTKRKLPAALQFADSSVRNRTNGSSAQQQQQPPQKQLSRSLSSSSSFDNGDNYTFRQLPLHMACGSLFRVEDPTLRRDLEQLIARLVIAYPEGCSRRDHQGRFPLHECIWYNAAPPIISALLMAAPDIARVADMQGVTPDVLNEHRQCPNPSHKKMVRGMLKKSPDFWRTARKEAEFRMKHRDIPSSDATITSTSVLASSVTDEETILSNEKLKKMKQTRQPLQHQSRSLQLPPQQQSRALPTIEQALPKRQQAPPTTEVQAPPPRPQQVYQHNQNPDSVIKPMAWAQLEKRALALEQKLGESYEHIYVLNQQLNELKGAKTSLQTKVDKFSNTDLGKRVVQLEHEKDELQFHLARSQALLAKHGISLEEVNVAEGMPPLPPLQISFSTEETAENTSNEEEEVVEEIVEEECAEDYNDLGEEEIIEEIIEYEEDEYAGSAEHLNHEQQRLAQLKEQLQTLTNSHMDYQDRLEANLVTKQDPPNLAFNGDLVFSTDDEHSTKSELTMDMMTIMTPASRLKAERPEPEGDASLVGTPKRMSSLAEEPDNASENEDVVGPLPSLPAGTDTATLTGGSLLGDHSTFELDSIIAEAMALNDGQGLSPELIEMWKATSVGSHGPSLQEMAERYMEEQSLIDSTYADPPPVLGRRPVSDNASLV
mmetsp:Transcript_18047/g.49147  ORF Transcript_18047/g.49147 Transcript_18047/m.49147 type:complete len:876 (+) Transcript_18047:227-2854(+)